MTIVPNQHRHHKQAAYKYYSARGVAAAEHREVAQRVQGVLGSARNSVGGREVHVFTDAVPRAFIAPLAEWLLRV